VDDRSVLEIGTITLEWSPWVPWPDIAVDDRGRGGVRIPNKASGVYEVQYAEASGEERLHIGKATDLRWRIRQGLVKGIAPHSTGKRIRAAEDVSKLVVRWAVTDRPSCAEEGLHRLHREAFGALPKYTLRT